MCSIRRQQCTAQLPLAAPSYNRVVSELPAMVCCVLWHAALDDNRMLCLPSGERIRLDESRLRLMFEVEDLAAASPATVSR